MKGQAIQGDVTERYRVSKEEEQSLFRYVSPLSFLPDAEQVLFFLTTRCRALQEKTTIWPEWSKMETQKMANKKISVLTLSFSALKCSFRTISFTF
jgi:hypothetical protein